MKKSTKVLFVRIPDDWFDKMNQIAQTECRTQVSIARQAIKEFLEKRDVLVKIENSEKLKS
jgi:predicted transcriptional regulator